MSSNGERDNPPQYTVGQTISHFETSHSPHISRHPKQKKRPREEPSGHDDTTHTEEPRKKRKNKRTSSVAESTHPASVMPEAVTINEEKRKKKKEKKKSKKHKNLDVSFESASAADHGLKSTADSSSQSEPNLESSASNSLPQLNDDDDVLRAFQSLDFSRLAGVLKNLETPIASVDLVTGDNPTTELLNSHGPIDNQARLTDTGDSIGPRDLSESGPSEPYRIPRVEPPSAAIHTSNGSKSTSKTSPDLPIIKPSIANPKHTELLATKWLSASKLKELVQSEGLVFKKGKFSSIEQHALNTAIEHYRVGHDLTQGQLLEIIFSKTTEGHASFWPEITASVPARPIIAVYHYVHRAYNPLGFQGRWTEEEDAALIHAVQELGQAWQKVKDRVGRSSHDCRDRWRNHLANRSERQRGPWSKEEEEELTRIVQELTADQGKHSDSDIFWSVVSKRMGNKRGRQQCRIKWMDTLNKTIKNGGETPRWNKHDSYILVSKVASLDVHDDSEINWQILQDDNWNLWSAHLLQRQWRRLTQTIGGYEDMAHQEIIEILKQKNPSPLSPRKASKSTKSSKKISKTTVIQDEEDECESEDEPG